jgi:O-antigen ligase
MLAWFRRIVLVLVALTLPFEWASLALPGIVLTPSKVVTALLLVLVAVQWAIVGGRIPGRAKGAWIAFFGAAVLISALHAFLVGIPASNLIYVLQTWFFLLLFYFVLVYVLDSRRELDLVLAGLGAGAILVVVSGLLGYGLVTETAVGERLGGQGGNPNQLAFNLLIAMCAAFALFYTHRSMLVRGFALAVVGFCLVGIIGSLSRSAYLAVALMGLFWILRFGRYDLLRYTLPLTVLLGIALVLAPESFWLRLDTIFTEGPRDYSAASRIENIPLAFTAFASNPILGVGLLGFRTWSFEQGTPTHVVHNAFLQIAADQGLLGLIPFVAIMVLTWLDLSRAWSLARRYGVRLQDAELRGLGVRAVMLQVAFLGVLVASQFQTSMRHKGLWLLVALSTVSLGLVRARLGLLGGADQASVHEPVEPLHPALDRVPETAGG